MAVRPLFHVGVLLGCVYFCAVSAASAAPGTSGAVLALSASPAWFDYREYTQSGTQLNQESGLLPGVAANLAMTPGKRLSVDAGLEWWQGTLPYEGRTTLGGEHSTDTAERLWNARLGADYQTGDGSPLHIRAQLQYSAWRRDIQARNGVRGLDEDYAWWDVSLGGSMDLPFGGVRQQWQGYLLAGRVFAAQVTADLTPSGFDTVRLSMGEDWSARVGMRWLLRLDHNAVFTQLEYRYWRFAASEAVTISNGFRSTVVQEPRSESQLILLSVGLAFDQVF